MCSIGSNFLALKVIPSKDADRNANSFNPDQTVSL